MDLATVLLSGVDLSPWLREIAPDAAAAAIERQRAVLAAAAQSGQPSAIGDDLLAIFGTPAGAAAAALAAQRTLARTEWPDGLPVRVRIAIGETRERVQALREVAHGGQTLLSSTAAAVAAEALPDRAFLADLGVHRLRDLSRPEHVYELRHPDLPGEFPPLRSLDALPHNLPVQLTSFVGRANELAQVRRLLVEQRLVTLAGAGGAGKTRLALQAAAGLADRWPDGVWWVDLGSITEPERVARLAAATLRLLVDPASEPVPAFASQLRGRRLLVCLDTCEHLLEACAELAEAVLRTAPEVTVLATSREPLGVPGETVWRVPALAEAEAVRLFGERAALVRPGNTVGSGEPVRGICRRLDGIPLAIELAAAWVRVLTPAQIATELDHRLLANAARGTPARHRSLAASMAWSHDLLGDEDRVTFRRLAVFTGGFTLQAARAVCGDAGVLTAIGRLVDKSLVMVYEEDGEARYRLLDTVREYAEERLAEAGEAADIRDRHLDYYLGFAERAEPALEWEQDAWRQALEREHDNLRAALHWALGGRDEGSITARAEPGSGRRLAAALARFWFIHGHVQEGLAFLRRAAERGGDNSTLQSRLLAGITMLNLASGKLMRTFEAAERGLALAKEAGDAGSLARCLAFSGCLPLYRDFREAVDIAVEAQRLGAEAGDAFAVNFGRTLEVAALTNGNRHEEAVLRARAMLERCLPHGERFCAVFARVCETYAALFTGDVRRASDLATDAVRIAEPLRDYFVVGHAVGNLAWVKCIAGEIDAGRQLMEPMVRFIEAAGPDIEVPLMAMWWAKLHLAGGNLPGALEWFERAARFTFPDTVNWVVARALPGLAGTLRRLDRLEEARICAERGIAVSRQLDCPHTLAEALAELAFLVAREDPAKAEDLHHEALAVRVAHGLRTFYVDSLEALAALAIGTGSLDGGTRLLAACEVAREAIGYARPPIDQPDHDAALAAARDGLGEAFPAVWAEGARLSLDEAVGYATRARGTRGRPATGWASLTPTELDVVRLVVAGLSNPQIGARLFMSRATVKTHLSHVYVKLTVSNRTELATLASSHLSR